MSCTYDTGDPDSKDKNVCFATNSSHSNNEVNLKFYTCNIEDQILSGENGTHRILRNGSFSEAATLFYGTGEQAVYHLYSKNTHKQFSYTAMVIMLVINFLLSCYTAGTFLSCGIVVPMLLIGKCQNQTYSIFQPTYNRLNQTFYFQVVSTGGLGAGFLWNGSGFRQTSSGPGWIPGPSPCSAPSPSSQG